MKKVVLVYVIMIVILTGCGRNQEEIENAQKQILESFNSGNIEEFKIELKFYRDEIGSDSFYMEYLDRVRKIEEIITLINKSEPSLSEELNKYKTNYGEDLYYKRIQEQLVAYNQIFEKLNALNKNNNKILVNSIELIQLANEIKHAANIYLSTYEESSLDGLNDELDYFINILSAILEKDFNKFVETYNSNRDFKYITLSSHTTDKIKSFYELSKYEKIVIDQLEKLISIMKNPESLNVLEIRDFKGYGTSHGASEVTFFEISAQNGFGGYNREWYEVLYYENLSDYEVGEIYSAGKYAIVKLDGEPYQNAANVIVDLNKIIYYSNL